MRVAEDVIEEALSLRVPPLEEGMREGISVPEKAGAKHAGCSLAIDVLMHFHVAVLGDNWHRQSLTQGKSYFRPQL